MKQIEFIGVDGCPGGWFAVGFDMDGEFETRVFDDFSRLVSHYSTASLILVDIPIGLPEDTKRRICDVEARKYLVKRTSSLFPTPTRQAAEKAAVLLAGGSKLPREQWMKCYRTASDVNKKASGRWLTLQAFSIAPKIAEVDAFMRNRDLKMTPTVREVHPEVCFWALNNRQPTADSKKTKDGIKQRLDVLKRHESRTVEIVHEACSKFRRKIVAQDDILDALVAAVTARRPRNTLQSIPKSPEKDPKELPMEMVFVSL